MTSATKRFVFGDVGNCIAFGFGVGLIPRMPGTAGTLLALPLFWLSLMFLSPAGRFIAVIFLFTLGVWLCGRCGRLLGVQDDGGIVLDEIAAFYAVLIFTHEFISDLYLWQAAAFILFRFFDIVKPPPINWLDKNIGGGWGVMMDDMAAAFICMMILYAAAYVL